MLRLWVKFILLIVIHYHSSALGAEVGFSDTLYQQIVNEFHNQYKIIGNREANRIIQANDLSFSGGLNAIGFSYRKPFLDFSLVLERNVAPDLFDDKRWIISDVCLIEIEATKLFGRLKKEGQLDISEKNLALFSGMVFQRKFTWVHFSNSYQDGLRADLDKLFFPFLKLDGLLKSALTIDDILTKEDQISFKAGGIASVPLSSAISASTGILTKFQRLSKTEIFSAPRIQDDEVDIHISNESSRIFTSDMNMSLVFNFLKIIKLNLFSYDFSYSSNQSHKIYLSLPRSFLLSDLSDSIRGELNNVVENKLSQVKVLTPYLISEEEKMSTSISHKYNFIILGGMKTSNTQQVTLSDNYKSSVYFKHYFEKIKYTEDPLSKILGEIIYSLTNSKSNVGELSKETRRTIIEYASTKNLIDNKENLDLSLKQQISIAFDFEYYAKGGDSAIAKKNKATSLYFIDHISELPSQISDWVNLGELSTPSILRSHFQIQQDGLYYFNKISISEIYDQFHSVCTNYPKNSFYNFRNLFDHCNRVLQDDYNNYRLNLTHDRVTYDSIDKCEKKSFKYLLWPSKRRSYIKNCIEITLMKSLTASNIIPLWDLKNLLNSISASTFDKVNLYNLFGIPNVFHYGSYSAKTKDSLDFNIYYHSGLFQNLGVVDDFMRLNNFRSPSSISLNQWD